MSKWIITGISGSDRIELLEDIKQYSHKKLRKPVFVHDVGKLIADECRKIKQPLIDKRILDVDRPLLASLRSNAMKNVKIDILQNKDTDLHLIGVHATFRWKNRLIPGISFNDLIDLKPDGFIHVHRDIDKVMKKNKRNRKWDNDTLPDAKETQEWMMEEEFVTEVLAEVLNVPIFVVSRDHNISNLVDLFLKDKKKVYLSYPITAVEKDHPDLLKKIQGPILKKLEELFVVFNPLSIQEMPLTYPGGAVNIPELVNQLTPGVKDIIKKRTIERDFQFIDQSDAVVVFYLTDKLSPGVLAEIYYAHRHMKPVYMVFLGKRSPFLEDAVDYIENDIDSLLIYLEKFAKL